MNAKNRLDFVDKMRGFAILMVVVGHLIDFNGWGVYNTAFQIIYSFHMPLFFAISGFIVEKVSRVDTIGEVGSFCLNKILSVGLPFFCWEVLIQNYAFRSVFPHFDTNVLLNFWNRPHLWFFKDLLMLHIVYSFHRYVYVRVKKWNDAAALISAYIVVFVCSIGLIASRQAGINLFLWSIFFYTGVMTARYHKLDSLVRNNTVYCVASILFVVMSGHWHWGGDSVDDLIKCCMGVCMFVVTYNFFLENKLYQKIDEALIKFGRNSLIIYVIQFFFCSILFNQLGHIRINNLVLFCLMVVTAVPICYISCWVAAYIRQFPVLDFLLIGNVKAFKRKSFNKQI